MSQATAAYRMHWVSKTGRTDWCETPLSALINDSDEEDAPYHRERDLPGFR